LNRESERIILPKDWPIKRSARNDVSEFFTNLGRQLGCKAVPAIRKSKWIWDGLAGTEEESLRAEAALGSALANELRAIAEPVDDPALVNLLDDLCQRTSTLARVTANLANAIQLACVSSIEQSAKSLCLSTKINTAP